MIGYFKKYERPTNHDHLSSIIEVLSDIKYRKVNFDPKVLQKFWGENKAKLLYKFSGTDVYCKYSLFGSKTGRLTLEKDSLPILNLKKEYRAAIKPNNDFFIELDYNAAEARVVLAFSTKSSLMKIFMSITQITFINAHGQMQRKGSSLGYTILTQTISI